MVPLSEPVDQYSNRGTSYSRMVTSVTLVPFLWSNMGHTKVRPHSLLSVSCLDDHALALESLGVFRASPTPTDIRPSRRTLRPEPQLWGWNSSVVTPLLNLPRGPGLSPSVTVSFPMGFETPLNLWNHPFT